METEKNLRKNTFLKIVLLLLLIAGEIGSYYIGGKAAEILNIRYVDVKIPFIDDKICVIPIFFIAYAYAYIFWFEVSIRMSFTEISNLISYTEAAFVAYVIGALVLCFFPAYMNRGAEGLLAENAGVGLKVIQSLCYSIDGWEMNRRIMPSFHCLTTTVTALEAIINPNFKRGYGLYAVIVWILVTLSVLFVKQHYFLDAVVGTLIGVFAVGVIELLHYKKED